MSLSTSLAIATSSLASTQVQLSVTANNISNADTEGYTAKSVTVSATVTAGVGTGVSTDGLSSAVNRYLINDLVDATSEASAASTTADYLTQLQSAFGSLQDADGTNTGLGDTIADFEEAMTQLATTPESSALAYTAVTALEDLTNQISDTAGEIKDLMTKADQEIQTSVEAANEIIENIANINALISKTAAAGNNTADLEDQLTTAIVQLSEYLDVTTFSNSDGSTKVYSSSGQILVGAEAHPLSLGIDVNGDATISVNGSDITNRLSGSDSKIGALLELRQDTLPDYAAALDEFATTLIDTMNAVVGLDGNILQGTGAGDIAVVASVVSDPSTLLGSTNVYTTATNLLDALQGDSSFDAAGKMAASSCTFTEYITDLISVAVSDANTASDKLDVAEEALSTAESAISSACGVNVDEETERLTELEQLYALASTIISTIQEMFEDLQNAYS